MGKDLKTKVSSNKTFRIGIFNLGVVTKRSKRTYNRKGKLEIEKLNRYF
jgi:hypothetical protein